MEDLASEESDSEESAVVTESASSGYEVHSASRARRFTARQKAILCAHYNASMKGVGELYSRRMASAAREAGLEVDQVKVVYSFLRYRRY